MEWFTLFYPHFWNVSISAVHFQCITIHMNYISVHVACLSRRVFQGNTLGAFFWKSSALLFPSNRNLCCRLNSRFATNVWIFSTIFKHFYFLNASQEGKQLFFRLSEDKCVLSQGGFPWSLALLGCVHTETLDNLRWGAAPARGALPQAQEWFTSRDNRCYGIFPIYYFLPEYCSPPREWAQGFSCTFGCPGVGEGRCVGGWKQPSTLAGWDLDAWTPVLEHGYFCMAPVRTSVLCCCHCCYLPLQQMHFFLELQQQSFWKLFCISGCFVMGYIWVIWGGLSVAPFPSHSGCWPVPCRQSLAGGKQFQAPNTTELPGVLEERLGAFAWKFNKAGKRLLLSSWPPSPPSRVLQELLWGLVKHLCAFW